MNPRKFVVSRAERGRSVTTLLCQRLRLSAADARRLVHERRVWLNGAICADPGRRVVPGQRIEFRPARRTDKESTRRPPPAKDARKEKPRRRQGPEPVIRYADAHVVVVDKPPGLTTVRHAEEEAAFGKRGRRFLPPTLADLLPNLLPNTKRDRPPRARAVHRLDKDTSGLVVFALTPEAERHLGGQFRAHTTERTYLALVRGPARSERIDSHLGEDRGDGRRGSTQKPGEGKRAVTHVRLLESLGGYALVECRLETGRTHQVRIHLGERGTPLCGERIYDRPLHGAPVPDGSGFGRPALHAASLGFEHPATGKRMSWTSPLPSDMAALLARLRRGGKDADTQGSV